MWNFADRELEGTDPERTGYYKPQQRTAIENSPRASAAPARGVSFVGGSRLRLRLERDLGVVGQEIAPEEPVMPAGDLAI